MTQTLNDLALLSIGIGFGAAICLVAVLVYALYRTASSFSRTVNASLKLAADQLAANKLAIQQMQSNVNFALSRLDAEALRASSLAIQRAAKTLGGQVDQLQKVVFAQPAAPALDFSPQGLGMDVEAEDDARLIDEQRSRWQPSPLPPQSFTAPPADPLAGLSEEEKRRRTLEYFERRRAAQAGFPYPAAGAADYAAPSAPPTAGSGIYASLLEEAASRPPAPSPAPDFSGTELDSEVDLVGKGELE
ncbi:MAG: hypothetical protein KGL39_40425 [Patescibacteria group bacterium]|nr:hypothetical protein [Patescibacteria group bacterium]